MAIKAIINNTEKEIEQIKNSDGQDIDYIYSRIGEKEAEGESTVSIKSIGGELTNYRIYGNTINGESVGDRTANLWDEIYEEDDTLHYVPIAVGDGFFTLSTTIPKGPPANIFFLAGNVGSGASTVRNGVWGENSRTIKAVDGYVTIAYMAGQSYGEQCYPWNNDTMLNAGSTALPYEPYGYQVPITVEGKNLLPTITATNSKNGILLRSESDGTVIVNGTATANTFLPLKENISYPFDTILSGCPQGGSLGYCLRAITPSKIYADYGGGILIPANTEVYIEIRIESGFECNNLEFKPMFRRAIIMDYTYEPYHEPITTNLYLPEQIKMVGDEAEYVDFKEQKFHRIGADDIDVTLPALSTIKGTNTLSVNTSIQPSNIYIKDGFDYKRVFTATRAIEGIPPLTYKAVEGALNNYRIYGNTVDGESVGNRTANLFANLWKKGYIRADNGLEDQIDGFICSDFFPVEYGQTYSISRNINVGYDNVRGYRDDGSFIGAGTDICDVSNPFPSAATNIGAFTVTNENVAFIRFNDSANDLGMKYMIVKGTYTKQTMPDYEPYGYEVPVTISGKNLIDRNTLIDGYYTDSTMTSIGGTSGNYKSFKLLLSAGTYTFSCSVPVFIIRYITSDIYRTNPIGNKYTQEYTFTLANDSYVSLAFRNESNTAWDDSTTIQIELSSSATEYEPYHEPTTTNIYLSEPLRKINSQADYIDYKEQKFYQYIKKMSFSSDDWVMESAGIFRSYNIGSSIRNPILVEGYTGTGRWESTDKSYHYVNSKSDGEGIGGWLYIHDDRYSSLADFKAYMITSPIVMYYQDNTNSEGTDIMLPSISTISDTNIITIETNVKPSKIYLKGKIKEVWNYSCSRDSYVNFINTVEAAIAIEDEQTRNSSYDGVTYAAFSSDAGIYKKCKALKESGEILDKTGTEAEYTTYMVNSLTNELIESINSLIRLNKSELQQLIVLAKTLENDTQYEQQYRHDLSDLIPVGEEIILDSTSQDEIDEFSVLMNDAIEEVRSHPAV